MELKNSKTAKNLMRAFAGECQARARYELAAAQAKKQQLFVIADLFTFTAKQEKEHAEVFFNHMKCLTGENIPTENAAYPAGSEDDMTKQLETAAHNEEEENRKIYPDFAAQAKEEGFPEIAASFETIGSIEGKHAEKFRTFAELLSKNKLFDEEEKTAWMCLNCGYIFEGTAAPKVCPACKHPQGYYIRLSMTPWGL